MQQQREAIEQQSEGGTVDLSRVPVDPTVHHAGDALRFMPEQFSCLAILPPSDEQQLLADLADEASALVYHIDDAALGAVGGPRHADNMGQARARVARLAILLDAADPEPKRPALETQADVDAWALALAVCQLPALLRDSRTLLAHLVNAAAVGDWEEVGETLTLVAILAAERRGCELHAADKARLAAFLAGKPQVTPPPPSPRPMCLFCAEDVTDENHGTCDEHRDRIDSHAFPPCRCMNCRCAREAESIRRDAMEGRR